MKKAIGTCAVLASIALATAPVQAKVLIFLLGGQSNMAGCIPAKPGAVVIAYAKKPL